MRHHQPQYCQTGVVDIFLGPWTKFSEVRRLFSRVVHKRPTNCRTQDDLQNFGPNKNAYDRQIYSQQTEFGSWRTSV